MTAITSAGRRALRRLLVSTTAQDRTWRRAGVDPFPVVAVTPRTWIALG
jgi:hypothetical protein